MFEQDEYGNPNFDAGWGGYYGSAPTYITDALPAGKYIAYLTVEDDDDDTDNPNDTINILVCSQDRTFPAECAPLPTETPTPNQSAVPSPTMTLTPTYTPGTPEGCGLPRYGDVSGFSNYCEAPEGATCIGTAISNGSETIVNVRPEPSATSSPVVISIYIGGRVGVYGTNSQSELWYFVQLRVGSITYSGWIRADLLALDNQPACDNLAAVDNIGTPLPPSPTPTMTPTPDPNQCTGYAIYYSDSYNTNIRDYPSSDDTLSATIGSFGLNSNVAQYVLVDGRFTNNTSQVWDDWYKVQFTDNRDGQVKDGWVTVNLATLRPAYDLPACQMPTYALDENNEWQPGDTFTFAASPQPLDGAEVLFDNLDFHFPEPFARSPVADSVQLEWTQGYGLNTFAYRNPNYYEGTNHIHSGLDFGGTSADSVADCPECIPLVPVCSGVLISLSGTTGEDTGAGFVMRCFAAEGSLSNIYVSYNHLRDVTEFVAMSSWLNEPIEIGQDYGLYAFPYPNNNSVHLHLEVFFDRDGNLTNGIRLNPLMLFTDEPRTATIDESGPYYPIGGSKTKSQFEWAPPDTEDPIDAQGPSFDALTFLGKYEAIAADRSDDAVDLDLGIQVGEHDIFSLVGDFRSLASGQAAFCTYVWGRQDHRIIFRYSASQTCPSPDGVAGIPGLQEIPSVNTNPTNPDVNRTVGMEIPPTPIPPYNGTELPAGRLIRNIVDLANQLQAHER